MKAAVAHDVVNKVASDEPGPAGDKDSLHGDSVAAHAAPRQGRGQQLCEELSWPVEQVHGFTP